MFVGKLAVGVAAVLAVGTGVAVANGIGSDPTVVIAVVDGDTIDVSSGGEIKRVRLLNVDAPESVHPDEFIECMGPEATAFLEELLPAGTEVALAYDRERTDRYDRELAGVTVGEMFVNAEIARAGLGIAVLFEPNSRFYQKVREAQLEAIAAGRGLYDEDLGCTLPGRVAEVAASAETVLDEPASVEDGLEAMESYSGVLSETMVGVVALTALLNADDGLYAIVHRHNAGPREILSQVHQRLEDAQRRTREAIQTEKDRIEAERLEAERLERERQAAERREAERVEAERLAAQEQREREQREAERRAAAQRPSTGGSSGSGSGSGSSGGSSGSGGSGGYDGYTGCRAYGGKYPPNAIDEQGRPYTKIDCSTKRPIGG
ncbi:MAG: thermonuclease family protein [Dermatophilaceae bacterium]